MARRHSNAEAIAAMQQKVAAAKAEQRKRAANGKKVSPVKGGSIWGKKK